MPLHPFSNYRYYKDLPKPNLEVVPACNNCVAVRENFGTL